GYYPAEMRAINLDVDWFYRKGARLFYRAMDRGLNGINSACERLFVARLTGYLGRISQDAPARMSLLFLVPLWRIAGKGGEAIEPLKSRVYRSLRSGASPVGISAGVATIYLILVFLLS
ncbi:MAG: Na(+)/H(+) antiporter subunit D, partial [Deltaproteobacteria bacterium]|nr:Na(+)/H(+) antiporter subunit D [Deltaproteobacteria bacterium]